MHKTSYGNKSPHQDLFIVYRAIQWDFKLGDKLERAALLR
jgi:hypothetical protein